MIHMENSYDPYELDSKFSPENFKVLIVRLLKV